MTYPPQPPGPYGQQPPQGPYNQGPYNQGPYPYQQPNTPWAQGPQGGFPVGPPPKKPRTGLITSLIIVAILVVGGGGVGAYFLLSNDKKDGGGGSGGNKDDGARAAAQTYVRELENALNTKLEDIDLAPLKSVTCGDDFAKMESELGDAQNSAESSSATPGNEKVRIRMKDYQATSDGGTFTMTMTQAGNQSNKESRDMTVAKEDGGWKVCGIYAGQGGESGG
jgi:hypothetical protein